MVLLNMYGRIQPTTISKKLGVGISNPSSDWIAVLQDDLKKEILIHKHDIALLKKDGSDISWALGRYDLEQLVNRLGWYENGKVATQIIAEHLIEIQVLDFDNSLLQMKNEYLDSPTCEPQYTRKFLNFCCMVQSSKKAKEIIPNQIPFSTYNSDDLDTRPLILNYLESILHPHPKHKFSKEAYTAGGIKSLKHLGCLIDNFLVTDDDFWLLDYIMNAVFSDREENAYHLFKVMSLIEMLIINPKGKGKTVGEIEQKLPQFLPDYIEASQRALFSDIMRRLRNKIGHGDFKAVHQLLEQYQKSFMKNFWFDEYEYSVENWIYGNICLNIDKALNEILWLMLSDKAQLMKIQCN